MGWRIIFGIALVTVAMLGVGIGLVLLINDPSSDVAAWLVRVGVLVMIPMAWIFCSGLIWTTIRTVRSTLEDISDTIDTLPESTAISKLEELGFRYVGTLRAINPKLAKPTDTQMFVDASNTISAEVGRLKQLDLVGFEAHFHDGSILQVSYPWGENITTPRYKWRYTTVGIKTAYEQIQVMIEEAAPDLGSPTPVRHVQDLMVRYDHFQATAGRHQQRGLRRYGYAQLLGLIVFSLCLVAIASVDFQTAIQEANEGGRASTNAAEITLVALVVSLFALLSPMMLLRSGARLASMTAAEDTGDVRWEYWFHYVDYKRRGNMLKSVVLIALFLLVQAETSVVTEIEVDAAVGWVETGVSVTEGDLVDIEYLGGLWTTIVTDEDPYHGADGGVSYICISDICAEPLVGHPKGKLIGMLGDEIFPVGDQMRFVAMQDGQLLLRINDGDDGLYDNAGSITVQITQTPDAILTAPAEQELVVVASGEWQSSTIFVNVGDRVAIHAIEGRWQFDSHELFEPDDLRGCDDFDCREGIYSIPQGNLVARIGDNPAFAVAQETAIVAQAEGILTFQFWETTRHDNGGSVTLQVEVTSPQ